MPSSLVRRTCHNVPDSSSRAELAIGRLLEPYWTARDRAPFATTCIPARGSISTGCMSTRSKFDELSRGKHASPGFLGFLWVSLAFPLPASVGFGANAVAAAAKYGKAVGVLKKQQQKIQT
ncbi:uncharacterized protein LOC117646455 [Thrips palmi]|uniref:Uncharacterized protein LOC117646455 n=1 Tax=Thrips palmi TaxID=161013 RepID=A0A6P8Z019_THRPL|nr:uncharacterized protein LOC117646455 [Thrips palmi]